MSDKKPEAKKAPAPASKKELSEADLNKAVGGAAKQAPPTGGSNIAGTT